MFGDPRLPMSFWQKVAVAPSGCWEWTASLTKSGYGVFWWDGKHHRAHRFAFAFVNGEVSDDLSVMHDCDNRRCVRLDHLRVGTHADNMADRSAKGRTARPYGEAAGNSRLVESQVRAIRNDRRGSTTLARAFGVSKGCILAIRNRKTWSHIP